jgi:pantothenate synthetase
VTVRSARAAVDMIMEVRKLRRMGMIVMEQAEMTGRWRLERFEGVSTLLFSTANVHRASYALFG